MLPTPFNIQNAWFACMFVFFKTESLFSSDCPRTHSVEQAGLEFTEICCGVFIHCVKIYCHD